MTNSSTTQPPEGAMDTMLMPSVKSAVGIVVDGRYRLDELLGEGGMGAVYRGTHVLMGKPVAIKLIHGELAHLSEVVARFEREARSASLLKDPHCISVTDFGKSPEGMLYLVMELLEGEDLHSRVKSGVSLSTEQALRIVKEVGLALAHAHSVGVVHRDLKPENIMLVRHGDEENFAKVIDFGIARIADSTNGGDDRLTRAGFVLGTPAYLSPEQALGEVADHRADLYALGVILYEVLSGHQPYSGDSAMDVVTHHLSSPVPRLPRQRYTPELQAIVDKAMAKSPTQRFQSAAELVEAIDGLPVWALVSSPSWVNRIVPTKFEDKLRLVANSMQRRYRALPPKTRRFAPYVAGAVGLVVALIIGLAGGDDVEVQDPSSNKALMVVESPGVDEKEIKAMLERADTQLRGGLAKEAVITAKEILSKSPGQWSAQLLLGHAKFAQGERLEALDAYSRALKAEPSLATDIRLGEYLDEAFLYECCRKQAATLLLQLGGKRGMARVVDKASSPLAPVETRKVSREALIAAGKQAEIDWLASLTADLEQAKGCAERAAVIEAIVARGDSRFVPVLEAKLPQRGRARGFFRRQSGNPFYCVRRELQDAIEALTPGEGGASR